MVASVRTTTISPKGVPSGTIFDSVDVVVASGDGVYVDIWYGNEFSSSQLLTAVAWDAATANQALAIVADQALNTSFRLATAYLPNPAAKTSKLRATFAGSNDSCWMRVRHIIGHDTAAAVSGATSRSEVTPITNNLPITITAAVGETVLYSSASRVNPIYPAAGDLSHYQMTQIGTGDMCAVAGDKSGAASVSMFSVYGEPTSNYSNAIVAARIAPGAAPAPVITGPSGAAGAASISINVAENSTSIGTWTATDGATWSISGGADASQVSISVGGVATFNAPNDYENPDDVGANRVYNITIQNVGAGGTATQDVAITLTNVTELPGAPTIGTATAGNASASVAFTPPATGSAPAPTSYTATSSPGGLTGVGSASPITVSGLTNGVAYTFSVTATNSDGTGSASAASNPVTPLAGPSIGTAVKDTPTATTATMGFSTDTANGTARAVWVPGTSVPATPSSTQVKAGQNAAGSSVGVVAPTALTITSTGAKNFASAAVTQGLTYYGFIVHTNASGTDSNVLAIGPVYPGTGRAVSDVATNGWTGSAGGALADLVNEDTANDANYITSPGLTSTPVGVSMALNKPYGAGTYTGIKARLWSAIGPCAARIKFMDNSGTVVGTTADQSVTTTPTTFTMSVTLTGTATRWMLEGNA